MIALLIGGALAAGTFAYAKKKKNASTGQSAAAAAVGGAAGWVATTATVALVSMVWPVILLGGVGAAAFYVGRKKAPKALPPASE